MASIIEGRPVNGSEVGSNGMPVAYMIFCDTGRSVAYCWEIEHAGVGVTGNTADECLATWLEEYQYETGKQFVPKVTRKQMQLAF